MVTTELVARSLHIMAASIWVGYLAFLAWIVLPAARGASAVGSGPILLRMRPFRFMGPIVFLLGSWLVTTAGYAWGQLSNTASGQAILLGIVLAAIMMGLEHGLVYPSLRNVPAEEPGERAAHMDRAGKAANAAAVLGFAAIVLMVGAATGGLF